MTKISKPMTYTLVVGGKELVFDQRVRMVIELDDRIIIHLNTGDFDHGDPLVGRNIVCYDKNGEFLWRIKDTGMLTGINDDVPQSFLNLVLRDDGRILAGNVDAFFCIRPSDGTLYDGEYKDW